MASRVDVCMNDAWDGDASFPSLASWASLTSPIISFMAFRDSNHPWFSIPCGPLYC